QLRDERLDSFPFDLQSEELETQRRDARGGDLLHAVLSSSGITPFTDRSIPALHTARYLTRKPRSRTSLPWRSVTILPLSITYALCDSAPMTPTFISTTT